MTASLHLSANSQCPRILEIRVTPVAVREPPLLAASGMHEPWPARTILELACEWGAVGLSETFGDKATLDDLRAISPQLVGLRVTELAKLHTVIAEHIRQATVSSHQPSVRSPRTDPALRHARIYAAFESAMLDAHARALGVPLCELLGGPFRKNVSFAAYLFYKVGQRTDDDPQDGWGEVLSPQTLVGEAALMIERHGFRSLKLKGGVLEPDEEVESIAALASAFPGYPLRIDPNGNWSVDTTLRILPKLNALIQYLEDPVLGHQNMARIREQASVPLATNMCVTSFDDMSDAVRTGSVDLILSDPHYWGGLRETVKLDRVCSSLGLGLAMHSNTHLGVSLMTMAHTAASCPGLTFDADTHYPWVEQDVVQGGKIEFINGTIRIPDAPGLGILIDQDALAQMAADYEAHPSTHRDDTVYMRKRWPEWTADRPRF